MSSSYVCSYPRFSRLSTELLKNEDLPELMRGLGELLTETDAKALQGKAGPMIDFPSFLNIMAARMVGRDED